MGYVKDEVVVAALAELHVYMALLLIELVLILLCFFILVNQLKVFDRCMSDPAKEVHHKHTFLFNRISTASHLLILNLHSLLLNVIGLWFYFHSQTCSAATLLSSSIPSWRSPHFFRPPQHFYECQFSMTLTSFGIHLS